MKSKVVFFLASFAVFFSNKSYSQSLSLGGGLSLPTYWGDLNSNRIIKDFRNNTNLGVNLGINLEINKFISLNGGFVFGNFQGDDANSHQPYQIDRNLNFFSRIFESNLGVHIHPFAWRLFKSNFVIIPFIKFNIGIIYTDPKTRFNNQIVRLQPLGTEGQGMAGFAQKYSLWNISGGGGGGIKILLNESFSINIDSRLMMANSDYLDDISRFYVNFQELRAGNGILAAQLSDRTPEVRNLNEPLNRPTGSQRGGAARDMYFITNVSLHYNFYDFSGKNRKIYKNKVICPKFN